MFKSSKQLLNSSQPLQLSEITSPGHADLLTLEIL